MKQIYKSGAIKQYEHKVSEQDIVNFETGTVHKVYSTFALTRDAEWTGRLFVLDIKEANEEGIGTMIKVIHKSPALIGETVRFTATIKKIKGNEIIVTFFAKVNKRLIAEGETGQKILKKKKLVAIFNSPLTDARFK